MTIAPPTFGIFAVVIAVGCRMFACGRRGVAIDDHPVCAKCKFDLTGRPEESTRCPECGTRLWQFKTIEIGNRRRQDGLMYGGLAVAMLGFLALLAGVGAAVTQVSPIRFGPVWWLLREAAANWTFDPDPYRAEILRRAKNNSLSAGGAAAVARAALALQANLGKPWRPMWGDIIEAMQSNGKLSAADWQTYQAQNETARMDLRPYVARGDPIPFHISGELRGGTPLNKFGNLQVRFKCSIPGAVAEYPSWSGGFGSGFDASGFVLLTTSSWDHLKPGTQQLSVSLSGLATAVAANPTLFPPITLKGNWTLLKDGEQSVHLYKDEPLAAQLEQTINCTTRVDLGSYSDISVDVKAQSPPADFAYEVYLRSGSKEWSTPGFGLLRRNNIWDGSLSLFEHAPDLIGQHVDIVLRPSAAAAAHTVQMDKLLDHEFVFKDFLIGNKQ